MLERAGPSVHDAQHADATHQSMVAHLLNEGYLNGVGTTVAAEGAWDTLNQRLIADRQRELDCVLNRQPVTLAINQRGWCAWPSWNNNS